MTLLADLKNVARITDAGREHFLLLEDDTASWLATVEEVLRLLHELADLLSRVFSFLHERLVRRLQIHRHHVQLTFVEGLVND